MKRFLPVLILLFSLSILAVAAPVASNIAYVMVNDSPLYQDNPDKTLKYLEGITLGDSVTLVNKTATFKESGKDRDFTRVKAPSGKEGWVRTQFIAAKATLAVVKADDSLVFSEPRDVKVTSRSISAMTVVAVMADGSTAGFSKVQGYDGPKNALFDSTSPIYMIPTDLSTSDADIQAAILFTVASASKSADVKKSLLKLAQTKYPGSIFISRIEAVLSGAPPAAAKTGGAAAATIVSVRASSTMPPEATTSYRYDAELLFDGNPLTAWVEGSTGSGEGESIDVVFASPTHFDAIEVMPGFFDARWFKNNVRVKQMQIELYDAAGSSVFANVASFMDQMVSQRVAVPEGEITRVVFTIISVYAPEQKDLAISEISFWKAGSKLSVRTATAGSP
jgi:hypothetical protein